MSYAVITADVVNSTRLSAAQLKKLRQQINAVVNPHTIEFFRGDSLQVLVKNANEALEILLRMRAVALQFNTDASGFSIDLKAGLGIGPVNLPVKQLATASGMAFILSGRGLDELQNGQRLQIITSSQNACIATAINTVARFIDFLCLRLTAKQAAVVLELLKRQTQTAIAKKLKKSQATINKHAQAAAWPQLEKLILDYKLLLSALQN